MEADLAGGKLSGEYRGRARIKKVAADLRGGRKVSDLQFDQVFPPAIRKLSEIHWTPLEVAIRAAELLVTGEKTRILDIGSGAGKFCLVGALATAGQFIGVEQRPHLLQTARKCAEELGAQRASFILGDMRDLDWDFFDGFYLYNPFDENRRTAIRIDDTVSHSQVRFNRSIEIVRTKLLNARPGTKAVTYHGFGGDIPAGYRLSKKEVAGTSFLELWVKTDSPILKLANASQVEAL